MWRIPIRKYFLCIVFHIRQFSLNLCSAYSFKNLFYVDTDEIIKLSIICPDITRCNIFIIIDSILCKSFANILFDYLKTNESHLLVLKFISNSVYLYFVHLFKLTHTRYSCQKCLLNILNIVHIISCQYRFGSKKTGPPHLFFHSWLECLDSFLVL